MGTAPITGDSIPASPDQLTDAWLTGRLRADGAITNARIVGHTAELMEFQGAAAVVARIALDYDVEEAGAPRSIVAKFASPHEPIRLLMRMMGGYAHEIEFYRRFGGDPGIPTPHCFHADIDADSGVFVLLLEDMSDSRMPDGYLPSIEDIEAAVRYLAPFHARWWNHPRLRELDFLRHPASPSHAIFLAQARGALSAALPAARARFGSTLPPVLVTVAERLLANFDAPWALRQPGVRDGITIVHGDFHPGQMFFPSEQGGRFAVFDWQTVSAGSGGDDLARIIATGLTAEQQQACDMRLISLYHSLLVKHGVAGYDMEQCQLDFRAGLLTTVAINIIAGASIAPEFIEEYAGAAEIDMTEAMFGRLAAAVEAHDVLSAIPG